MLSVHMGVSAGLATSASLRPAMPNSTVLVLGVWGPGWRLKP